MEAVSMRYLTRCIIAFLSFHLHALGGVVVQAAQVVQVVPQGIESVNGSNVTMGCTSPLVDSGDGVMVCSSGCSTLLDGISPTIDTNTSDWASQLVTVRKTEHDIAPFSRVLLTFGFYTAVTVTRIELDLFLCPEWNIGAPAIIVYANTESNLNFSTDLPSQTNFILSEFSESSCDSLSTVTIIILRDVLLQSSYLTWHILMSQFGDDTEWVHIGEVRFVDADIMPKPTCSVMVESTVITSTPMSSIMSTGTTVFGTSGGKTVSPQLCPTSVPGSKDCTCSESCCSVGIAVSAVFFLLTVTLITVILIQCLLILRMRRSVKETPAEYMTPTTMNMDVPVSTNEAYGVHKITEETTYELVK